MLSRVTVSRHLLARLYSSSSSSQWTRDGKNPRAWPAAKIASSRYELPQKQKNSQAKPRMDDGFHPGRNYEPFPFAITEENEVEVLRKILTPLHESPYQEQLESKEDSCRRCLRELTNRIQQSGASVRVNVNRLPCSMGKIVPATHSTKYRNFDELSIWYGHDGKTPTVGYLAFPITKHGDTVSVAPNGSLSSKDITVKLADILQEFVREQTKVGVSYTLTSQSGWRRFRIFSNSDDELMLTGFLNPRNLRVSEVSDECELFRDFMCRRTKDEGLNLKSLYYQATPHSSSTGRPDDFPFEFLSGEKNLVEKVGPYKYVVTPTSHVFPNTSSAANMFEVVRRTIKECFLSDSDSDDFAGTHGEKKPVILEANSGSGIMSIVLSDMAEHVIGVDLRSNSIEEAQRNMELNGIENLEYLNADLGIVLPRIIDKYCPRLQNELIVVCDIPSGGIRKSTVEVLRRSDLINKILLTVQGMNLERVMSSIEALCVKDDSGSRPFVPVMATPVDMIPMADKVTVVLALQRFDSRDK